MRRLTRKVKQALSILMAVAMVVTMVPQTGMNVSAAELTDTETAETEVIETDEIEGVTSGKEETENDTDEPVISETEEESEVVQSELVTEGEETAATYSVTFTYDETQVTVSDVMVGEDATELTGEALTVEEGKTVSFCAEAKEGYENVVVKSGQDEVTAEEDGSYLVTITTDTAISIEATAVEEEITTHSVTFSYAEDAPVEVSNIMVAGENTALENNVVKVEDGNSLSFEVGVEEGYQLDAVKIGEVDVEKDADAYTVDSVTSDITITITVSKVEEISTHTVTFVYDETQVVVGSIKVGEDDKTLTEDALTVEDGGILSFTAEAADGYENVVVSDGVSELESEDGRYVLEITADTEVTITASPVEVVKQVVNVIEEDDYYTITNVTGCTEEEDGTLTWNGQDAITFKVNVVGKYQELVSVSYSMDAGEEVLLESDDETGIYTISVETLAGEWETLDISAYVEDLPTYEVHFEYDASRVDVIAQVNDKEITVQSDSYLQVLEDEVVKFKVTAKKYYVVESVTVGDEIREAAADGFHVIDKDTLMTNPTVAVDAAYAESTRILRINDLGDNAVVTIDGKEYGKGKEYLTDQKEIKLSITTINDYEINSVSVPYDPEDVEEGGTEPSITAGKDGVYTLSFGDSKGANLYVETNPMLQLKIQNNASNLTYAVKVDGENAKLKSGTKDVYLLSCYANGRTLTVTAPDIYIPNVVCGEETLTVDTVTQSGSSTVYTYSLAVYIGDVTEEDFITTVEINQEVKQSYVVAYCDTDEVSVAANISGQEIVPMAELDETAWTLLGDKTGVVYQVPIKSKVNMTVKSLSNTKVVSAAALTQKADGSWSSKTVKSSATGLSYSVTTTGANGIEIKSEATYKMVDLYNPDSDAYAEVIKGTYYVEVGKTYKAEIYRGAVWDEVTVNGGTLKIGKNAAKSTVDSEGTITISAQDAGKTITATLKDGDNTAATFKMYVRPAVTEITISGVKNGKLTQELDCVKEYAIKVKKPNKYANAKYRVVTECEEDVVTITENNTLEIVTGTEAIKSANVTIQVWNGTEYVNVRGGSFALSTKTPVLTTSTVKLAAADDVSLTLNLTSKGVTDRDNKMFYRITVKPQGTKIPESITAATGNPFYVEKTGTSQNVKIIVNNAEFGEGCAWKFNVDVALVYTAEEMNVDDDGFVKADEIQAENVIVATGNTKQLKKVATKTPWYEMSLKLKAVNKQVYTTQEKVHIATVQFSKNTTHTENFNVADVTSWYSEADGEKLTVWAEGNKIYASAGAFDPANYVYNTGTHTIRVTADVPEGAKAATAEIKVNVVLGIQSIHPEVAPMTIYKADKKTATTKVTARYNEVEYDYGEYSRYSYYTPKTQKVTWKVVKPNGDAFEPGDRLYNMITVKKGVVTVNKNYIVGANTEDNQFAVKVTAADFAGNSVSAVSDVVTITSQATQIEEAVVVRWARDEETGYYTGYEVIARNGDSVTPEELAGAYVKAVKKGVGKKDVYTWDEVVDENEATVKSGNKAVLIHSNGYIYSASVKNGVTFTVTALDGSKASAKMKVNVVYDKDAILGLQLNNSDIFEYGSESKSFGDGSPLAETISYKGNVGKLVNVHVTVYDEVNDWYAPISEYKTGKANYNYAVEIKNATVVESNESTGYYRVALDKAAATIKLTNKITNETMTYTLKNESVSTKAAPSVSASHNLKSYGWRFYCDTIEAGDDERPSITFKLPKVEGGYEGKKVVFGYDWSSYKKNASNYQLFESYGFPVDKAVDVNEDGSVTVEMGVLREDEDGTYYYTYFEPGTYKVTMSVGTLDDEGNFIADSKPATVSIKIAKPTYSNTKYSFKPTTSYKIKKAAGATVELTGKRTPSNLWYEYDNLQNAIVNGQANHFTDFFELAEDGTTLRVKEDADLSKCTANDLIGYVDYSSYNSGCVKITLKWK